ncbi:heterokaryon incompatibility protein-domain-containing protein [Lasiosphaeria hispida]|uniref:Heterokaryon incompatibility protein-domain-containing protein n=1 Tax=Lasiosphaeria hispida TaxID=260671 RepID=A0AAJ0HN69_9PEZI|nr:heterokaryon incompatibility protein-domain-containing protein [Lasiosphaeria hispida]
MEQPTVASSIIYSAHPLLISQPDIRLVVIHPSTDLDAPISCSLRVVDLDKDPRYEALSYCWGDAKITADILVENTVLPVTTNLVAALRQLRRADGEREMWIDAICINQDDSDEKVNQIPLMRAIYSDSIRVVVWLGPQDTTSRDAFHFLGKAAEKYNEGRQGGFLRLQQENDSILSSGLGRTGAHFILDKPMLPTSLGDVLKPPETFHRAVTTLLRRPWFRRVWIIQEVAFARSAVVLSGRDAMDWDAFINAVRFIDMAKAPRRQYHDTLSVAPHFYITVLSETRDAIASGGKRFTIRDALRRFAPFESTLPRDKVFALQGLLKQPEAIEIDYNSVATPDDEVFRRTAARAVEETGDLSLLLDRHTHDHDQNHSGRPPAGLPSWLPDWFVPGSLLLGDGRAAVSAEDRFCASRGESAQASFLGDGRLLVSGYVIDRVARVGRRRPSYAELGREYWLNGSLLPKKDPYGIVADSCEVLRDWMVLSCPDELGLGSVYATGETMREAFWQTLLRPDVATITDESAQRDFEAALRVREWMFMWMDWFVRRVDRGLHWAFIWALLSLYMWIMGFAVLVNLVSGRLGWAPEYTTPVDPDQSDKVMARTTRGLLAFVPAAARVDDRVVLVQGVTRPCILRPSGKDWRFIGPAYVHGIMYGGAFEVKKCVAISLV